MRQRLYLRTLAHKTINNFRKEGIVNRYNILCDVICILILNIPFRICFNCHKYANRLTVNITIGKY